MHSAKSDGTPPRGSTGGGADARPRGAGAVVRPRGAGAVTTPRGSGAAATDEKTSAWVRNHSTVAAASAATGSEPQTRRTATGTAAA